MSVSEYDLVVIGSGPAGQKGAIAAAKARKRVAIIDRAVMIGGVSVHTGMIPSKTVREAIFQLTGFAVKALYGRLAACHMFGIPFEHMPDLFPYGIYTIPEISMVGQTEETLTSNKVPYEVGIAKYSELAKSMMLGDEAGMLKLLFHPETHKLLGVHALGQRATEIIHIGQAVLFYGGSVEYFRDMVFNYPTLAEAYKVAALNGLNKL